MNPWTRKWFSARQANTGGIIRRKRRNVEKYSDLEVVITEAKKRGWHVIETGNQIVLLCHEGELVIHC